MEIENDGEENDCKPNSSIFFDDLDNRKGRARIDVKEFDKSNDGMI